MEQEPKQRIYRAAHKANCKHCGKEFEAKLKRAQFCSGICRATYHRNNPGEIQDIDPVTEKKSDPIASTSLVATMPGLPPQAQYIITHLKELNTELKDHNKDLTKQYDDLKNKNDSLRQEIDKITRDHELEAIRNEKPSGLQGLAENPLVQQFIPHLAPALGRIIEKLVDPGTKSEPTEMAGVEIGDAEVKAQVTNIAKFYASLDKESQHHIYTLLNAFVGASAADLKMTITKINNLLKNGTTAQPFGAYTGTFN